MRMTWKAGINSPRRRLYSFFFGLPLSHSLSPSLTLRLSLPLFLSAKMEETLIIFDWDDTVMPSSWVLSLVQQQAPSRCSATVPRA